MPWSGDVSCYGIEHTEDKHSKQRGLTSQTLRVVSIDRISPATALSAVDLMLPCLLHHTLQIPAPISFLSYRQVKQHY